jgi:hypothetical protein
MSICQLQHEIPRQLSQAEDDVEARADGPEAAVRVLQHDPQSLARFGALLAGAATSGVVGCRKGGLKVETAAPFASGLWSGS